MERMWQERADYGHFFYRIPNGESAADAYDRISGFNESLWRQFGEEDCASVCVLGTLVLMGYKKANTDIVTVTHGLMSRVFLMKWYHFSVEYFEDLRNVNHCEFLIMRKKEDSGKYILENNLRTWSELRREREAARKEKEKSAPAEKAIEVPSVPIPKRRQWGGCPNGCQHGKHSYKRENSMQAMKMNGKDAQQGDSPVGRRPPAAHRWLSSSDEDEDDPRGRIVQPAKTVSDGPAALDGATSSSDGTPSFKSPEDRARNRLKSSNHITLLQAGRDFGGSASGTNSRANSDTEVSVDEDARRFVSNGKGEFPALRRKIGTRNGKREESGMGRKAMANALGDQSDVCSDVGGEDEEDDLAKAEAEDKSVQGSVY
jgi:hypothetical protein